MMDLVFSELLTALFAGRMLLVTLLMVVGGYLVGWGSESFGARFGWTILILFFATGLFVTSAYIRTMTFAGMSGVVPKDFTAVFYPTLIGTLLALYFLTLWFGAAARRFTQAEDDATARSMSAEDYVAEIDIAAAHPALGQGGWFATRWYTMSPDERENWAAQHIVELRSLRAEILSGSLPDHGINLPVRLAQIDQSHR